MCTLWQPTHLVASNDNGRPFYRPLQCLRGCSVAVMLYTAGPWGYWKKWSSILSPVTVLDGFSGSNALHSRTLGLLGEMRDGQLPMLVKFDPDLGGGEPGPCPIYGGCDGTDKPNALVDNSFATDMAMHLLVPQVTMVQTGVNMNLLSNL
jgi:hypothetical protein